METQQGFTLWLTGMSGAGKSTLAAYLAKRLPVVGRRVEVLDMSDLEAILPEEPDSSKEIRDRNVRWLGWTAGLLTRNGVTPIVAAVSPYRELREEQRREIGRFFEVFVDCPFEILMERDSKGIYRRALSGELQDVVGVQAPYEPPVSAEVKVDMGRGDLESVATEIFDRLVNHGYLSRKERDILVNGSGPNLASAAAKAPKAGKKAQLEVIRAAAKKAEGGEGKAAPKAVKAETKAAPKAAAKPAAKAAAPKAPAMPVTKIAAPKAAAKPAAKATAPKAAAKPAAKATAPKAAAKPAAKAAAPKAAAKPAAKAAVPKAAAKPAAKAVAPKAAAKPAAKASAPKAASKPAAKASAPKAAAKPAAKAGSKK